jgi:energy-coupling factor transporter ATP-binding protein EcfA2
MSRLDLLRDAQRPKMCARAMFQGPQGSGKTWTMLSIARLLAGAEGRTIMFDTERESGLTYADVFNFKHLPWRAPYDPAELTTTLDMLATKGVPSLSIPPVVADDVLVIDSASHFWQGSGGILDIANGRVQGGWDKARPIQNALVEQILAMPCHVLLGARMKNSVLVSDNGKTVE